MSSNGSSPSTVGPSRSTTLVTDEQDGRGRRQQRRERPATAPAIAPVRTRRRSGVLAVGVALVVLGALGAAYLTQVVGNTVQVVAVARDVEPGQVVAREDLTVADVNADPALAPVPAGRLAELVGQRAAVALTTGSLVTDAAVTEQVLPGSGQSVVGVALQPAQLPAEALQPGDRVRIVDTPPSQAEPPSTTPHTIDAVVVSAAAPDASGQTIIDVTMPSGQAAELAARVATGRIALVLDSRER